MNIIRLPATMNLLDVDRHCARNNLKVIRFMVGREAKKRNGAVINPERAHAVIVQPFG